MIPLNVVFWVSVLIFAMIGSLRGWNREILVSFSIILALFLRLVFSTYVPFFRDLLNRPPVEQFYIYTVLVTVMALIGYAGPAASGRLAKAAAREKVQDFLLSSVVGAINGYLIVGTIWYFLHVAGYGIWGITAPPPGSAAMSLANSLPPALLSPPLLLTIVAVSFVYVLVKFL
ncbi:MAG: hypothetical protein N2508_12980 [Anaerolineae bacterium]|nr:hypothetical protein [Anaerolineae bacterium]